MDFMVQLFLLLLAPLAVVILLLVFCKIRSVNKLKSFRSHFSKIGQGMSKEEVIAIMGKHYVNNLENGVEVLVWECKNNSAVEREMLHSSDGKCSACVSFRNNLVVAYSLQ